MQTQDQIMAILLAGECGSLDLVFNLNLLMERLGVRSPLALGCVP